MKALLYSIFTAALMSASVAHACEPYPAEHQIDSQPSVERLLKKFSERLKADCRIPLNEDEYPEITIAYKESDERRSKGKIERSYTGRVECEKENGELIEGSLRGKVTIKFWRDAYNGDSCDGQIMNSITKLSSSVVIRHK